MKKTFKIISLAILISVLIGCQRQDDVSVGNGNELSFKVAVEGEQQVETRSYAGDVDINTVGFGLVGYKTLGGFMTDPSVAVPNVLSSSETLKSQGNVAWIMPDISAPVKKFKIKLPTVGGSSTVDDGETISYFAWSGDKSNGLLKTTAEGNKGFPFLDVAVLRADEVQKDVVATHALDFPNEYVVTSIDLDFHHIFSKMTFSVNNKTGLSIKIKSSRLSFASNKVYSKARYNYNCSDSIGVFASYANYYSTGYFTPTGWNVPSVDVNAKQLLGTMLLMPQPTSDGFLTVELVYTITSGATTTDITRVIPLKALALSQGKNYMYTLNIHAEEIEVIQASVGAWNEAPTGSLPLVPGPCGDDILLLDGNDAPYPYDGKFYWLDRSGYNNHCEIYIADPSQNTIAHDPGAKAYVFNRTNDKINNFIKIPDLSNFSNTMTIEMVASNSWVPSTSLPPTILTFSSDKIEGILPGNIAGPRRSALIHMFNKDGSLMFDYGGTNSADIVAYERTPIPFSFTSEQQQRKTFYAFTRNSSKKIFVRNSELYYYEEPVNTSYNNKNVPFTYGALGYQWGGSINYLKISKVSKSADVIQTDYTALKQTDQYDIKEETWDEFRALYLPPAGGEPILCFDSRIGLTRNGVWRDLSIDKNDLSKYGSGSGSIYKHHPTNKSIYLNNILLKLKNGFATNSSSMRGRESVTIEIIAKSENESNTILSFQTSLSGPPDNMLQLHVHFPWNSGDGIMFNAPYVSAVDTDTKLKAPSEYGNAYSKNKYTFRRFYSAVNLGTLKIMKGNDKVAETYNFINYLELMPYGFIGGLHKGDGSGSPEQLFKGDIYAVRVYDSAFSDANITTNYNYDKTAFDLP